MTERGADRCLCIFVRAPQFGRVKRRLAAEVGARAALAAHIELVEGTLERTMNACYRRELWLAGSPDDLSLPLVLEWCERFGVAARRQKGQDLGTRMRQALNQTLAGGEVAVLIGGDCPSIDQDYVLDAFESLQTVAPADLVIGPAEDGGYGLIGLRQPADDLFNGISWGTDRVLAETLQRAQRNRLEVVQLDPIYDVDTLADWQRFQGDQV